VILSNWCTSFKPPFRHVQSEHNISLDFIELNDIMYVVLLSNLWNVSKRLVNVSEPVKGQLPEKFFVLSVLFLIINHY
jgi:hypothetical protein